MIYERVPDLTQDEPAVVMSLAVPFCDKADRSGRPLGHDPKRAAIGLYPARRTVKLRNRRHGRRQDEPTCLQSRRPVGLFGDLSGRTREANHRTEFLQERPPSARWSCAFVIFDRPSMLRSRASS